MIPVICVGKHELLVNARGQLDAGQHAASPFACRRHGSDGALDKGARRAHELVAARDMSRTRVVLRFCAVCQLGTGTRLGIRRQWKEKYFEGISVTLDSFDVGKEVQIDDVGGG